MTTSTRKSSGAVSLFIGLAVLLFVLLTALLVLKIALKIFFGLAIPVGLVMAAYGGWRYSQSTTDADKHSAMSLVAGGLGIALLGVIF